MPSILSRLYVFKILYLKGISKYKWKRQGKKEEGREAGRKWWGITWKQWPKYEVKVSVGC